MKHTETKMNQWTRGQVEGNKTGVNTLSTVTHISIHLSPHLRITLIICLKILVTSNPRPATREHAKGKANTAHVNMCMWCGAGSRNATANERGGVPDSLHVQAISVLMQLHVFSSCKVGSHTTLHFLRPLTGLLRLFSTKTYLKLIHLPSKKYILYPLIQLALY